MFLQEHIVRFQVRRVAKLLQKALQNGDVFLQEHWCARYPSALPALGACVALGGVKSIVHSCEVFLQERFVILHWLIGIRNLCKMEKCS